MIADGVCRFSEIRTDPLSRSLATAARRPPRILPSSFAICINSEESDELRYPMSVAKYRCDRSSAHEALAVDTNWWNSDTLPRSNPSAKLAMVEVAALRT